jgi:probable rRNA maturation factor
LVILHKRIPKLSESSLERFVLRARRAAGLGGTVNVLVTTSSALRSLNRQFRGKNKATDVLSFPSLLSDSQLQSLFAGDIAISADIAAQNAVRLGHSTAEEIKILTLHGILHLAGFDHERDNGVMGRKESRLRQRLGLPSGLIERSRPPQGSRDRRSSQLRGKSARGCT